MKLFARLMKLPNKEWQVVKEIDTIIMLLFLRQQFWEERVYICRCYLCTCRCVYMCATVYICTYACKYTTAFSKLI